MYNCVPFGNSDPFEKYQGLACCKGSNNLNPNSNPDRKLEPLMSIMKYVDTAPQGEEMYFPMNDPVFMRAMCSLELISMLLSEIEGVRVRAKETEPQSTVLTQYFNSKQSRNDVKVSATASKRKSFFIVEGQRYYYPNFFVGRQNNYLGAFTAYLNNKKSTIQPDVSLVFVNLRHDDAEQVVERIPRFRPVSGNVMYPKSQIVNINLDLFIKYISDPATQIKDTQQKLTPKMQALCLGFLEAHAAEQYEASCKKLFGNNKGAKDACICWLTVMEKIKSDIDVNAKLVKYFKTEKSIQLIPEEMIKTLSLTEYFENHANERAAKTATESAIFFALNLTKNGQAPEVIQAGCPSLPMSFIKMLTPDMTVDAAYELFKGLALATA
jgi:hypothetical protein